MHSSIGIVTVMVGVFGVLVCLPGLSGGGVEAVTRNGLEPVFFVAAWLAAWGVLSGILFWRAPTPAGHRVRKVALVTAASVLTYQVPFWIAASYCRESAMRVGMNPIEPGWTIALIVVAVLGGLAVLFLAAETLLRVSGAFSRRMVP